MPVSVQDRFLYLWTFRVIPSLPGNARAGAGPFLRGLPHGDQRRVQPSPLQPRRAASGAARSRRRTPARPAAAHVTPSPAGRHPAAPAQAALRRSRCSRPCWLKPARIPARASPERPPRVSCPAVLTPGWRGLPHPADGQRESSAPPGTGQLCRHVRRASSGRVPAGVGQPCRGPCCLPCCGPGLAALPGPPGQASLQAVSQTRPRRSTPDPDAADPPGRPAAASQRRPRLV
jgi:hypothetical protein